jgi:MFS family permease
MIKAYRGVLAIADARALIGASAASQLGNWLYNAALLGYVYGATRSVGWVGAATIFRLVPYVVLGPAGGVIADRYPRRVVLLIGDILRLLLMVLLATLVAVDGPVALVIVLTGLASAAGTAERPAAMALLPRLVGESQLGPANALLHTVQDLGVVVGPAIGAVLLAVAPAWIAFAANGATFALSAVLISTMRPNAAPAAAGSSPAAQLASGLQAIRGNRCAAWLIVVVAMVEFTYGAQTVQLVVYATESLGLGRGGYGILLAAAGGGGLLSAVVNGALSTSRRVTLIVIGGGLLSCATQLAYASVETVAIALVVSVIGTAGAVSCEVVGETALARVVPRAVLGQVIGISDAASAAAMVAGALLAPFLIAYTSLRISLIALGTASVLVTVLCRFSVRGLDAVSARRVDEVASRVRVLETLPVTLGVQQLVLEQLAASAQFCPLPPGVDVVVQGAPAHAFYAVTEGRVVVHRDGKVRVHLGPGDSFGERGLLDNAPRNATVTTEVDSILLRVEGQALLEALEAAPTLRPSLDLSSTAPGVQVQAGETVLVDDLRWTKA